MTATPPWPIPPGPTPARSAGTDVGRAVNAALTEVPGTATSADWDDDHGRTAAWHVDVTDAKGTDHEVTVDARSGKVTAVHTDRDDDHSDDNGPNDDRSED